MRESVVVRCSDPAVAVTVTIDVADWCVLDEPPEEVPLAHPESRVRLAMLRVNANNV